MVTVNNKGLRQEVWNFINLEKREKPLLVWAQYGCHAVEDVRDTVETYRHSSTSVKVTYNDREDADIRSFLSESLTRCGSRTRLICVSFAPYGDTHSLIESLSEEFDAVILQPDVEDWLSSHWASEIQPPIAGFLRKHPEYLCLPLGEKPKVNNVGYSPAVWEEVSSCWADIRYELWDKSPLSIKRKVKIRNMMIHAAVSIGAYPKLLNKLQRYIILHRSWNDIRRPLRPFKDFANGPEPQEENTLSKAVFSDVFETLLNS